MSERSLFVAVMLAVIVMTVYWQLKSHEFVTFDDNIYIYENKMVLSGLNWNSIVWAFTTGTQANWHPLTWLSIMLDYELFGVNAGWHHLMSAIIHAINTIMLFVVFKRMTKSFWASAFVAAFFGLHPLHVESVAWASERKDLLSMFFWMLTLLLYTRYVAKPELKRYLFVIGSFALGLLAKPMLVTMPLVLLLLDYWPLRRFAAGEPVTTSIETAGAPSSDTKSIQPRRPLLKLIKEKIPLIVLSVISSVVTFIAQQSGGAVAPLERIPIMIRLGNAFVSYITYIRKMLWPSNLAFFYPHPGFGLSIWWSLSAAALVIVLTIVCLRYGRKWPYLPVGWLWYLGTLVPVIGIVQVGIQALADRYTYIPLIGLSIIIAWGVPELLGGWRYKKVTLAASSIALLLALGILTWVQVGTWRDNMSLFSHAVAVTDGNYLALTNLGLTEARLGKTDDAIAHYKAALEIGPMISDIHNYIAIALSSKGKDLEAASHYSEAIRLKPEYKEAHFNLGIILDRQGLTDSAIYHFREALRLKSDDAEVHNNLGAALGKLGKIDEAIEHFEEAVKLRPEYPSALYNLGSALYGQGKYDEAILRLSEVVRLQPNHINANYNLGLALEKTGKMPEALRLFDRVLTLNPRHSGALYEFMQLTRMQTRKNQEKK
jgi:tetratricopeptide (TPR) repeat protein